MKVVFEDENQVLIPIIHYLCKNTLRNSDLRGYFIISKTDIDYHLLFS